MALIPVAHLARSLYPCCISFLFGMLFASVLSLITYLECPLRSKLYVVLGFLVHI
jgi:hypothetical protein